jgi:hypothetical protein
MRERYCYTTSAINKVTNIAESILESRHPTLSLNEQMVKSPDILLLGAVALSGIVLTIFPVETGIEMLNMAKHLVSGEKR